MTMSIQDLGKLPFKASLSCIDTCFSNSLYSIVPDDKEAIQGQIQKIISNDEVDLILTSGGTGFSPRDITPETVSELITKRADSMT